MKTPNTIKTLAATLSLAIFFSNCTKDPVQPKNNIQQGHTVIEINAIFPNFLQVRYNNVIDAPINVTVTFYLKSGELKNIPVSIPAGYKNLVSWGNNNYINTFDYSGYTDSTGAGSTPIVPGTSETDSLKITAVNCPDKEYGFKVLSGADDWTFYKPKDSVTSINFICNKDTISYSDYDFNASTNLYNSSLKAYAFYFFGSKMLIFASNENYPIFEGMTMDIPLMVYYWNQRTNGSQPDGPEAASNGSTIQLNVTKVTATHFDATFSGKLWSSRQPDTLFISKGVIKNALLPQKQ